MPEYQRGGFAPQGVVGPAASPPPKPGDARRAVLVVGPACPTCGDTRVITTDRPGATSPRHGNRAITARLSNAASSKAKAADFAKAIGGAGSIPARY